MSDFVASVPLPVLTLCPEQEISAPRPRIRGKVYDSYFSERGDAVEPAMHTLPVDIVELEQVQAVAGTNFILKSRLAIHPDLFDISREVCPAETFGFLRPDIRRNEVKIRLGRPSQFIDRAISLLGQCAGNYAHWLTEILPKLVAVDQLEQYRDYPLLVDDWIHPVFFETLAVVGLHKREIIRAGRWNSVRVGNLVSISPPAYITAGFRSYIVSGDTSEMRSEKFRFSRSAMWSLRARALEQAKGAIQGRSDKLYLFRGDSTTGNARSLVNDEAVLQLVRQKQFSILDPGELSFIDQVSLFRDARVVVGPVGAAFANAIFCKPGCKVVVIAPFFEASNYDFFASLLGVMGHEVYFVVGPRVDDGKDPLQMAYEADLDALESVLNEISAIHSSTALGLVGRSKSS